jgi:hypothetical protein
MGALVAQQARHGDSNGGAPSGGIGASEGLTAEVRRRNAAKIAKRVNTAE